VEGDGFHNAGHHAGDVFFVTVNLVLDDIHFDLDEECTELRKVLQVPAVRYMSASKYPLGNGNNSAHEGNTHGQNLAEFRTLLVQVKMNIVQNKVDSHETDITCMMTGIVEPITLHIIYVWIFKEFVVPSIRKGMPLVSRKFSSPGVSYKKLIQECRSSPHLARSMKFGGFPELEAFATMWSDAVSSLPLQIHYPPVALANGLWESGTKPIPPIPTLSTASDPTWFAWR